MKTKSRRVLQQGRARAGLWGPLLLLLLLSMVVTGVLAQDDQRPGDGDLVFVEDEFAASPASINAATDEVIIPPSKDSYIASNDPNRNFGFRNYSGKFSAHYAGRLPGDARPLGGRLVQLVRDVVPERRRRRRLQLPPADPRRGNVQPAAGRLGDLPGDQRVGHLL